MNSKIDLELALLETQSSLTFIEISEHFHIPEALVHEMHLEGLFEAHQGQVDVQKLQRIASAIRLHQAFNINLPGVVLALELLDEIEAIQKELTILKKQMD